MITREIRLEAIGGQGAHTAGQLLAEAYVVGMGWSGHHFSTYGSEKRGTPVTSHVRAFQDRRAVRSGHPVDHPQLLLIFHELLLSHHVESWAGLSHETDVLVVSETKPSALRVPKGFVCRQLATIGWGAAGGKHINGRVLGAAMKLLPELRPEILMAIFERKFGSAATLQEGFENVHIRPFREAQAREFVAVRNWPTLGWDNAPLGGVIDQPGNAILRDHTASRTHGMPHLHREVCVSCGFCDQVCPDFCFVWSGGGSAQTPLLLGIDYQYCKGCGKCVEVCPVQALEQVPHHEERARAHRIPKYQIPESAAALNIEGGDRWWKRWFK